MKEFAEFRIDESFANLLFCDNEGKRLNEIARKINILTSDGRYGEIGVLQKRLREEKGRPFFFGWALSRRYDIEELNSAICFHLKLTGYFEPTGEQCGTQYDDSTACSHCGAGGEQISDLWLDLRKVPKRRNIARTIGNEWIISQSLAERMTDADFTGFELHQVRHKARYEDDAIDFRRLASGQTILREAEAAGFPYDNWKFSIWINKPENKNKIDEAIAEYYAIMKIKNKNKLYDMLPWYQVKILNKSVQISPETKIGSEPFEEGVLEKLSCKTGDLIGVALLSEVFIVRPSFQNVDISASQQFVGVRRGLLRPERVVFISQRLRKFFEKECPRDVNIEVARFS